MKKGCRLEGLQPLILFFIDDFFECIGGSFAVGRNGNKHIRINGIGFHFSKLTAAFFIFGIFGGDVFGYGIGEFLRTVFIGKPETRQFHAGVGSVGYIHCRIGNRTLGNVVVFVDIFIGYFRQVLVIHFFNDTGNNGIGSQIGIGIFLIVLVGKHDTDNDGSNQCNDRYGDNGK